jgi:NADH-quinone oxidoreductase subunit H
LKETIFPTHSNILLFLFAPIFTFITSILGWIVIPFSRAGSLLNFETSLLFIFAVSSLGVYGIYVSQSFAKALNF